MAEAKGTVRDTADPKLNSLLIHFSLDCRDIHPSCPMTASPLSLSPMLYDLMQVA